MESYQLAWYFAANHTRTDAWDKRKEKGFLFTIGDEPFLNNLPLSALRSILGNSAVGEGNWTTAELYEECKKRWHVYHIHIAHNSYSTREWRELMGPNLIVIDDYTEVSDTIANIIVKNSSTDNAAQVQSPNFEDVMTSIQPNLPKEEVVVDML